MSESPPLSPLIGNDAARAVHGFSRGADAVLLGPAAERTGDLQAIIDEVCAPASCRIVDRLAALVDVADGGSGPLVVADAGLTLHLPAVLDLLDAPGDRTAALLAEPRNIEAPRQPEQALDHATLARVDADGLIAEIGTPRDPIGSANRVVIGMLRISARDRGRAADLWRDIARLVAQDPAAYRDRNLFDLALLALVGGGLPVGGRSLGYYTWSRGPAGQTGIGASGWAQRLRSASRLGDGAYSAAVVRPLSRIGTRAALAIGLTPNLVTAISLAVGIIAGLLIVNGSRPAWIVAAVLLQLALVIDCMDGEIARFTRRFSAFGGWLDGIGDRIKEYLVFAAVAAVAVREGQPSGWLLAMIAMVVVTARHLEDYSYGDRVVAVRQAAAREHGPSTGSGPLVGSGPSTSSGPLAGSDPRAGGLPPVASRRQRMVFWGKKIAHVPIAERYLILSLALLTGRPLWVLVAAIAVSAFALVWTVGGRLVRALRSGPVPPVDPLDQQLDLGVIARSVGRFRVPFVAGLAVMIICWLVIITGICTRLWPVTLVAGIASVIITGCTLRPPVRHRLAWLVLPVVWGAESAVFGSLLSWSVPGVVIFITLAAVAYRRYELIYSIRLRGVAGPAALLGFDGRILLVAIMIGVASLIPDPGVVLDWGLVVLATETLLEAVIGTVRRWRHKDAVV